MNTEEVGKISYKVEIDLAALRSGSKTAEQAVKTSFSSTEKAVNRSTNNMERDVNGARDSLVALAGSIVALGTVGNFLGGAIDSANKYQASLLGLNSVALSFTGESQQALVAAQDLASDGLLPLTESATGLKNLLASGYGLPEAIRLMQAFKDSAAFGRQGSLSFGEAVRSATEGIKNGNSILVDNAGVTKNLSVILEEFGYSQQDVMRATTDAGVRMAIYNGILRETAAQTGNAAQLTETAAGADARLGYAVDSLNIKVGSLANVIRKDAVDGLATFINQNQNAIISIGSGAGAMVAFAAGAYGLSKALAGLRVAMTLIARHPIVATLTLLAGVLGAMAVNDLIEDTSTGIEDMGGAAGGAVPPLNNLGDAADSLGRKLRDLDDQTARVERDYRENLAKIVQEHEKSIKDLTKQINDENGRYNAAIQQRLADFQDEQGREEEEHLKKTKNLQAQIDFLRKYNNTSNKQQLSELQFTLAQENNQYAKRNQDRKAKYDADLQAERLTHEQRLADAQARLNEDAALLDKHRGEIAGIRGLILLDEIEALKRSRDEQLKSLQQQRQDAVANNSTAGAAAGAAFGNNLSKSIDDAMKRLKMDTEASVADGDWLRRLQNNFQRNWERNGGDFWKPLRDSFARAWGLLSGSMEIKDGRIVAKSGGGGWASGGYTGKGGVNEVAGLVHRGEYVLPQSMVNQSTGMPDPEAMTQFGSGTSSTYKIDINISGAIVNSPQDERRFAEVIAKRINETMQNKGMKPALGGF